MIREEGVRRHRWKVTIFKSIDVSCWWVRASRPLFVPRLARHRQSPNEWCVNAYDWHRHVDHTNRSNNRAIETHCSVARISMNESMNMVKYFSSVFVVRVQSFVADQKRKKKNSKQIVYPRPHTISGVSDTVCIAGGDQPRLNVSVFDDLAVFLCRREKEKKKRIQQSRTATQSVDLRRSTLQS